MWWAVAGAFSVGVCVGPFFWGALRKWFFGADGGF